MYYFVCQGHMTCLCQVEMCLLSDKMFLFSNVISEKTKKKMPNALRIFVYKFN